MGRKWSIQSWTTLLCRCGAGRGRAGCTVLTRYGTRAMAMPCAMARALSLMFLFAGADWKKSEYKRKRSPAKQQTWFHRSRLSHPDFLSAFKIKYIGLGYRPTSTTSSTLPCTSYFVYGVFTFPNKNPDINSEISGIYHNFLKLKNAKQCMLECSWKFTICAT